MAGREGNINNIQSLRETNTPTQLKDLMADYDIIETVIHPIFGAAAIRIIAKDVNSVEFGNDEEFDGVVMGGVLNFQPSAT